LIGSSQVADGEPDQSQFALTKPPGRLASFGAKSVRFSKINDCDSWINDLHIRLNESRPLIGLKKQLTDERSPNIQMTNER
jgi:hypothetical protein